MDDLFKEINLHFLIRYYPDSSSNANRLITARQCRDIIGDDGLFVRSAERALTSPNEKEVIKLRRGIQFIFVSR